MAGDTWNAVQVAKTRAKATKVNLRMAFIVRGSQLQKKNGELAALVTY